MIERLPPVGRIFDVVEIERMTYDEARQFFTRTFNSVNMSVEDGALQILAEFSNGHPKVMQLLGNAVFWTDTDREITRDDVVNSLSDTVSEFGKKYVEHQVYQALQSEDYRTILVKISGMTKADTSFRRADVMDGLSDTEQRKLDNLIQRLINLNVIHRTVRGEYVFADNMVRLYLVLNHWAKRNLAS